MEGGGGKFHAERAAELIQREHVGRVVVADCAAETYILRPICFQSKECTEPLVKSTGMTAQLVVLAAEPLYRYAYADVGKRGASAITRSSNHPLVDITILRVWR